jgi:hypothetical protein
LGIQKLTAGPKGEIKDNGCNLGEENVEENRELNHLIIMLTLPKQPMMLSLTPLCLTKRNSLPKTWQLMILSLKFGIQPLVTISHHIVINSLHLKFFTSPEIFELPIIQLSKLLALVHYQ